ncbi:kynurenine 3-monooxygenase [Caerostris darwini]|uniref:Kynurenine 3-monooxygenase n=1 Tax=Caerostris darwini TaxID=1538125 RepID=A0AAV4R2C4_9ARAC|nr:kynurenine 3-monooxygenase [Caerostris darwini]
MEGKDIQVSIIGGGLVGSLCSCVLAKHGIRVKLYEYRDDVRRTGIVDDGRRMNLVLSERGISALRLAGLEDINKYTTPITGRMMHKCDGTRVPFPMDNKGRCTYSIVRKDLNEVLLTMTEKNPNVEIFFKHKFKSFDFKNRKFYLQGPDGEIKEKSSDLLIGCDGAYSAVRRQMAKTPRFDCSQSYFDNGYIEITMPPTATGEFAMEGDYLHFWPRKNVMLAALPNKDRSYTVSLFMPFEIFEQLSTREKLLHFLPKTFLMPFPLLEKKSWLPIFSG